ncbi:4'-phosphopantetheinyl transferase family protein [Parashewanella tropica]|uniref:4'-phosphopantetheinyl transferase family protein n=1 Tax=Parashewanella tropica TaxID=2547970 RepID=UPI00105A4422|nr:4'-phosphopantetheinyl transferase superfamily protein [Parashewanella tropica]
MNSFFTYFHDQGIFFSKVEMTIEYEQNFLDELLRKQLYIPASLDTALLKRKCEFVAGRWCAVQAMKNLGISEVIQPGIGINNEPLWPASICGSISHTNNVATAIVTLKNNNVIGVGVDKEVIFDSNRANFFSEKIMAPSELIFSKCFSSHNLFITMIFSGKEALYKAIFPQIKRAVNFMFVKVCRVDDRNKMLELEFTQRLNDELYAGRRIKVLYSFNNNQVETFVFIEKLKPRPVGVVISDRLCL